MLAFLDSPVQLIIAAVVILVVFGPQKLPEIASQIGRALRELKRTTSELQDSFNIDHNRYDDHHNPPSYDSYGNPASYSEAHTATVPETDMIHNSGSQTVLSSAEPVHGDFAASALADIGSDYGHGVSTPESMHGNAIAYTVPAAVAATATGTEVSTSTTLHEVVARPAEGAVPRQS